MGFLGLEMPQWLLGIFIAYLIVAVLVVISQPFKAKNVICSVANSFSALRERFFLPLCLFDPQ